MAQRDSPAAPAAATGDRSPLQRAGEGLVYAALRAAWAGLAALPRRQARGLLEGTGSLAGRLDRRHRQVVEENLSIAFPGMDPVLRASVVEASFRNWGRIVAEVVHAPALIDDARGDPEWQGLAAAVAEARAASGGGLLVLTAHLGNFELLARIFGSVVAPVAVFHRPLGIPEVDAFLVRERARSRVRTLGRGATVRDSLRILADGGCVALPLDQNQREGRGIFVEVLGRPACTSTVLARLSLASGAPVLPVFSYWTEERALPAVGEPIAPVPVSPPGGEAGCGREEAVRGLTERYAAEVDRVVRRFPQQWNWAHRRWKTRPA